MAAAQITYAPVANYIDGKQAPSGGACMPVISPLCGGQISQAPLSTPADLNQAVQAAAAAFPAWSTKTAKQRASVFYNYRQQLVDHADELAALIHAENGKTLSEAKAEIVRAIEVTEFACSLPQLIAGQVLEVSPGVECRVDRAPLGVVASIAPFNFPAMVPHWTIPIALALGNCMIFKPSEKVPLTAQRTAQLLTAAGLPSGVFNVLHGDPSLGEAICDHPLIEAITFVGSTTAAKAVYLRGTSQLKRVLALGGAKNHLVALPDAHVEKTAENVLASMAGCAGQRCMAAACLVAVGAIDPIVETICEKAKQLIPGEQLGPVISAAARERIVGFINEAEEQGAVVLVDGRSAKVAGREGGFYLGPTVLDHVTADMRIAQEEVFGPVLAILRVDTVEDAVAIENQSPYGNAASIYTESGRSARQFAQGASAGMIGVNIGVPVPVEPFGFGGWNQSRFGVGDITGPSSIEFWTKSKKVTSRWNPHQSTGQLTD